MNKIFVYGRLTRDVELKEVTGRNCASFGVASQNKHKDKNTGRYDSNFYSLTAWGQAADIASRYLKKGNRVVVAGDLIIREYVGTDNQKHTIVEINNAELDLVETAAEAGKAQTQSIPVEVTTESAPPQFTPVEPDELPF